MKKLLTLIFCFVTLTLFSQKTKILKKTPAYEITTSQIECNGSWYESIKITNLTNHTIGIEFDVKSYWSNNPTQPTFDDEHVNLTLNVNESVEGKCTDKSLLKYSRSNITKVRLVKLELTNLIFSNQ